MKTNYHLRQRKVIHGDDITHYPNGTSILVNILYRTLKYNFIKIQRRNRK